ncbi:MAG TPA: ABC transporter substrate-binding protein [Candidatus Binatia bacterium]
MGISTTSIAFLSIYAAQLKGFYRDEGIDLELILMPATLASSAVLTGDIDYNGAVTGVIAAAVQERPMKVLIFTADRSLQSIISRKEIKEPKDLKGKKIAGSTPGATRDPARQTGGKALRSRSRPGRRHTDNGWRR